ncbi:nucleotidyltransferase domain-containing protein [Lichenicoccus sp.]|uniref:nucleotidyltransferase domain-containing protein n=1 Tax=Lichenicoccus sp. TaxID=2781899 RepID=UPI003D0A6785
MMIAAGEGDTTMRSRIAAMLDDIERDHRVRILLAVESGSRAWGFPSSDSDWDVRFLYLRPFDAYLRIDPPTDVIEVPLTNELDLNGWDLRKGLALLVASNAVFLEWLASPVVYRRDDDSYRDLAELAAAAAHLPALSYHYDRLARRHWGATSNAPVRFKTLFYALRPVLALVWMRNYGRPPPMDLEGLLAGLKLSPKLVEEIERVRALKAIATEADVIDVPSAIGAFLSETLSQPVSRAGTWNKSTLLANVDQAFFRMVMGQQLHASQLNARDRC